MPEQTPPSAPASSFFPDMERIAKQLAQTNPQNQFAAVKSLGQPEKEGEFTKEDSRYVYIRGYATSSAEDARPILGTNGAGPCLIVALYNPTEKTAMLAHIDANTDIQSLHKIIERMGGKDQPLQAHLAGGRPMTETMVGGVLDILKQHGNISIKSADIMNDDDSMKSLAIDSRTGEVYTRFMSMHMDKGPNHSAIMGYHASTASQVLPLRPDYVDGKSYVIQDPQVTKGVTAPAL
jgi:chemotaxis receptor (MCP) glutamine deamidase CheD